MVRVAVNTAEIIRVEESLREIQTKVSQRPAHLTKDAIGRVLDIISEWTVRPQLPKEGE